MQVAPEEVTGLEVQNRETKSFLGRSLLLRSLTMPTLDTSPAADERYHELLRRMSPEKRLEAAMRLSMGVRELALAGIRQRFSLDLALRIGDVLESMGCDYFVGGSGGSACGSVQRERRCL